MLVRDASAHGITLRACPRGNVFGTFKKRHVLTRAIARGGHGQRPHMALAYECWQAVQWHHAVKQIEQRRVIQKGLRLQAMPFSQYPAQR